MGAHHNTSVLYIHLVQTAIQATRMVKAATTITQGLRNTNAASALLYSQQLFCCALNESHLSKAGSRGTAGRSVNISMAVQLLLLTCGAHPAWATLQQPAAMLYRLLQTQQQYRKRTPNNSTEKKPLVLPQGCPARYPSPTCVTHQHIQETKKIDRCSQCLAYLQEAEHCETDALHPC
jgi:hypothetical protein